MESKESADNQKPTFVKLEAAFALTFQSAGIAYCGNS